MEEAGAARLFRQMALGLGHPAKRATTTMQHLISRLSNSRPLLLGWCFDGRSWKPVKNNVDHLQLLAAIDYVSGHIQEPNPGFPAQEVAAVRVGKDASIGLPSIQGFSSAVIVWWSKFRPDDWGHIYHDPIQNTHF